MGSFPPFPPELLGAIVEEVHSPSDLLHLRATNSTLNTLATPLAFNSVCLQNRNKSIENFKLLVKSRLAPYVHEVVFQYTEQEDHGTFVENCSICFTNHLSLRLCLLTQTRRAILHPHMHEDMMEKPSWKLFAALHIFLH